MNYRAKSTAVLADAAVRDTRLTALVSAPEANQIARRAAAARLSVSAYLRDRALGLSGPPDETTALRQIDALIERMQADLDRATSELAAAMARMERPRDGLVRPAGATRLSGRAHRHVERRSTGAGPAR